MKVRLIGVYNEVEVWRTERGGDAPVFALLPPEGPEELVSGQELVERLRTLRERFRDFTPRRLCSCGCGYPVPHCAMKDYQ